MARTYRWLLRGPEETRQFAERVGAYLQAGDLLLLEGTLGAGKTTFTQGLARGLGVAGVVNSPTFTIVKEYAGRLPLYHLDVYRVGEDIDSIGIDDYLFGEGVCVVEWASLIESVLPAEHLTITLAPTETEDERSCLLEPRGERYEQLCEELDKHASAGD